MAGSHQTAAAGQACGALARRGGPSEPIYREKQMRFITKTAIAAGIVAAAAAIAVPLAATASSAAVSAPATVTASNTPAHWQFGTNAINLTFGSTTYTYPVYLHTGSDGVVTGWLFDQYLAAENQPGVSGWLQVNGLVKGHNILLVVNYPSGDPQGARAFNFVITPVPGHPHQGTVAGVWDETGPEAATGAAALANPIYR